MVKHGAAKVVGVEGYGYVNGGGGREAAILAVAEGGGLPEERELQGRTTDNNNLTVLNNFNGRGPIGIKWMMFLALRSYWIFLLSSSVH